MLAVHVGESSEELLGDDRCQPERRLVEQDQPGARHHRPGDREHLLLATAHASGLLVVTLPQTREDLVPTGDVTRHVRVPPAVRADAQVVVDREIDDRAAALGDVTDTGVRDLVGPTTEDLAAVEHHFAVRVDRPRDRPQRGRLARAVGAEDDDHLAVLDAERDSVQHAYGAVATAQVRDLEQAHDAGAPR